MRSLNETRDFNFSYNCSIYFLRGILTGSSVDCFWSLLFSFLGKRPLWTGFEQSGCAAFNHFLHEPLKMTLQPCFQYKALMFSHNLKLEVCNLRYKKWNISGLSLNFNFLELKWWTRYYSITQLSSITFCTYECRYQEFQISFLVRWFLGHYSHRPIF